MKVLHSVGQSLRTEAAKLALRFARWSMPALASEGAEAREVGLRDDKRSGWFRVETRELFDGFPIASSDTVVDVGCGDGGRTGFCADFAAQIIAVDVDPKKVAATEQRLRSAGIANFKVVLSDGDPLPIKTAIADKVICTEVLEHVDDLGRFMSELVRIGKPGALYLLSVPDALSEQVLKRVAPPACFEKPNHIRIIGREEFEHVVTGAGLAIEKHVFCSFFWAVWQALVWKCDVDYDFPDHPALNYWTHTWSAVLDMPGGQDCKNALDEAMPKSQVIIARKPAL